MRIRAVVRAVGGLFGAGLLFFVVGGAIGLGLALFRACEDNVGRETIQQNFVRGCLSVEGAGRTDAYCRCVFEYMERVAGLDWLKDQEGAMLETGEIPPAFEVMRESSFNACIQDFDRDAVERDWVEGCLLSEGVVVTEAYCGCEFEHIERTYGLYSVLHELERFHLTGEVSTLLNAMLDSGYYACMQYVP